MTIERLLYGERQAFGKLQKTLSPEKHTNTSNIWTEQVIFGVKRLKIKIG